MHWSRYGIVSVAVGSAVAILVMAAPLGRSAAEAAAHRGVQTQAESPAETMFKEAISLELQREWALALDAAREAVALDPGTAKYVDKQARLAGFLMLDALAAEDRAAADALAGELLDLEANWAARPASAANQKLNAATVLRFGQAHYLTGDLDGAEPLLQKASGVGLLNTEADVWLYALYESQGDAKMMKRLAKRPWLIWRSWNPVYQAIKG